MDLVTTVLDPHEPRLAIAQGGAQPLQMVANQAAPCTLCWNKNSKTHISCDAPSRPVVIRPEPGHEADPRTLVVLESPKVSADSMGWIVRELREYTKGLIVFDYAMRYPMVHDKIKPGYLDKCRRYLAQTFEDLKPRYVVTYDTYAASAVAGFSVPVHTNDKLWTHWQAPWGPVWFSYQMSPTTARQAPSTYGEMVRGGLRLMFSEPTPALTEGLTIVRLHEDTLPLFVEWFERLTDQDIIRVDFETYGKPFNEDHDIDAAGISNLRDTVVFVANRQDLLKPNIRAAVFRAMTTGPGKTGWNSVFDLMAIRSAWGIDPHPIAGDDMAYYKLNDVERTATLEAASLQVGVAGHKKEAKAAVKAEATRISKAVREQGMSPGRAQVKAYAYRAIPEHIQLPYVGADSWMSGAVFEWQAKNARAELQGTWNRFGAAGTKALYKMGVQGFRLDLSKYSTVTLQLQEELRKAEAKLAEIKFDYFEKGEPVPWYSTDGGVRAYVEEHDADTGVRTSTDIMSVGAPALRRIRHMEFVAPLLEYRHIVKLISTYVDGLPYFLRDDGKVHTTYKLSGARSGRLSTCMAGWTPVRTARGTVQLRDVVVGDLVWTHRGRWQAVSAAWLVGVRDVYDVELSDGNVLTCTGSHRLYTTGGDWVTAEELYRDQVNEVAIRTKQRGDSDRDVPGHGPGATALRDRGTDGHYLCQHPGSHPAHPSGGAAGTERAAQVCCQAGCQEPDVRQERCATPPMGWRRGPGQPSSCEGVCVHHRPSDGGTHAVPSTCDVTGTGCRTARLAARPPCGRGPDEQRHGQSCTCVAHGSHSYPLLAEAGGNYVAVTRVTRRPAQEVYDLTVEEDHSYQAYSVFSHNCDPSVHQIPSRSDLGKLVKSWFIPDPGYILISADYKTLEVMIAANFSKDPTLVSTLEDVAAGRVEDLHLQTAMRIGSTAWGLSPAEVLERHNAGHKMYRTAAKSTMFGILYQMGPNKLAEQINVSKAQAEKVIEGFYGTYPDLRVCVDDTIRRAVAQGEAWATWDGERSRVRRLSDVGYQARDKRRLKGERIAFNHPIQSQASDICLMSVIQIQDLWERTGADRYVLGSVHDSIIAMVRPYDLHTAVGEMKEIMTGQPTSPLKLLVDFDIGYSWGTVKPYTPDFKV